MSTSVLSVLTPHVPTRCHPLARLAPGQAVRCDRSSIRAFVDLPRQTILHPTRGREDSSAPTVRQCAVRSHPPAEATRVRHALPSPRGAVPPCGTNPTSPHPPWGGGKRFGTKLVCRPPAGCRTPSALPPELLGFSTLVRGISSPPRRIAPGESDTSLEGVYPARPARTPSLPKRIAPGESGMSSGVPPPCNVLDRTET